MAVTHQSAQSSTTALFVRRPILAFVLSSLIVLAGLAGLFGAEIRELPDVDRPVITVTTNFAGASPETIDREITAQIEGAAGRVAGVQSISSNSRFGRSRVTIEFGDDADLDVAATDTRDAIGRIQNSLPDGADDPRIVKADANADAVMRIAVTSDRRTAQDLTQFTEDVIEDRLISVPGVADLQIYGDRDSVFRIDIDQMQLASRGLTLADIRNTLRNVAFDAPAGALSSSSQSIVVRTTATVTSAAEFEALTIRDGVTIGDVATVTLGPSPGESVLRANGRTGLGLGIIRQAQSNTLEISQSVRAVVDDLQSILPQDVQVFVTSDDAVFINGSIREVLYTLAIAIAIVIGIIFLFLRDVRATIIPAMTLPVALIGTLAAIYLVGFSVNILTLLALVLATGMVVDDAIVVLENIVRRRSEGMGARAAAVLGTQQVFFAVVTTTATLAAVFIPLSFLPGQTGGLFREFGFTLAMSVLLSSVVALSLCPVLASKLLKGHSGEPSTRGPMAWLGNRLTALYALTLRFCLAMPLLILVISAGFATVAAISFGNIRQELTPSEDRSIALLSVSTPQGVSLDYTAGKMREIEALITPLQASGEVTNVFSIAGIGSDNRGFMVMTLAQWEERDRSQQEIVGQINGMLRQVIGTRAFAIQPNSLGIRGAGRGLTFALTGDNYDRLADSADQLMAQMEQDPAFGRVSIGYETTQPQLFIEVDRDRASDLGVNIDGLGEALQAVLDGRAVGTVFIDDRSYEIKMVSTVDPVNDPGDLERIFVQAGNGEMIPISSFVRLNERAVAPELGREAQMRSVEISASLTPELSLGDAFERVQSLASEVLPEEQRIVPLAEAATLSETSSGLLLTFGFAIVVVFLVLSAQFESFVSALIIMATVPLGLACAVFALLLTGGSLNVYSQIGLVLLVGIMAKNGILMVEVADQWRDRGLAPAAAALRAASQRLRPIAMTLASTILAGLPLILSSGPGAEGRAAIGWVIVGGLGLAAAFTLLLTPAVYALIAPLAKPRAHAAAQLETELAAAETRRPSPAE